ncbi:hypothetical protein ACE1OE_11640 [Vibrio sp. E150_011]
MYDHGKAYEEMHVDGGLSHQLFFNTYGFDLKSASEAYGGSGTANANANLTNIEKDFDVKTDESKFFDENYMKALYDYGYDKAKSGQLWTATVKAGEKIEKREDELHDEMSVK